MAEARDPVEEVQRHFEEGFIDEEEFLLLNNAIQEVQEEDLRENNQNVPRWREFPPFDLELWTDEECWTDLRFRKDDIPRIVNSLVVGDEIVTYNRVRCSSLEAVCLLLRRLAFPCRFTDLIPKFGRPKEVLCVIFNHMLNCLYERFGHLFTSFDQPWYSQPNLAMFAAKIHAKGAPLTNCWGFIDGTLRATTRPQEFQRLMYNGHKRVHGFKFQSVTAPNGLIVNLFGPVEGSRHDSYVLRISGLLQKLEAHSFNVDGEVLCLYGDPAYPLSPHLQKGFLNPVNQEEIQYNQAMSSVRVSVEWIFGDVIERFKFTDFKKMMKVGLSAVSKQYVVSALLSNMRTCLYGSTTSSFFDCQPPALEEYLQPRDPGEN